MPRSGGVFVELDHGRWNLEEPDDLLWTEHSQIYPLEYELARASIDLNGRYVDNAPLLFWDAKRFWALRRQVLSRKRNC